MFTHNHAQFQIKLFIFEIMEYVGILASGLTMCYVIIWTIWHNYNNSKTPFTPAPPD